MSCSGEVCLMEEYDNDYISNMLGVLRPILMIDNAKIWREEEKIISQCALNDSYSFWKYHFDNNPVMPGSYMVEMLAQTAAFLLMVITGCREVPIIVSADKARFLREIKPNQLIEGVVFIKDTVGGYHTSKAKLICNGKTVCKAELVHYTK